MLGPGRDAVPSRARRSPARYIAAAGIAEDRKGWLFRTSPRHNATVLTDQPTAQADAWRLIRRRAQAKPRNLRRPTISDPEHRPPPGQLSVNTPPPAAPVVTDGAVRSPVSRLSRSSRRDLDLVSRRSALSPRPRPDAAPPPLRPVGAAARALPPRRSGRAGPRPVLPPDGRVQCRPCRNLRAKSADLET
jgi:hypothetical protein